MNNAHINKLTSKEQQAHDEARDCTYATLRHGGVLLRCGIVTKNLEGKDAKEFINKIRDKGQGYIKTVVRSYFDKE